MKSFRFKAIIMFALISLLISFTYSGAEADTDLGEICWQFQNPGGEGSHIFKFRVFDKGGGHYYLSGVNTLDDGSIMSGSGNAEINGSNIVINIPTSGVHPWGKSAQTINMTLDRSTLNGSWFSLAHEIENDGSCHVGAHCLEYYEGTATHISCQ